MTYKTSDGRLYVSDHDYEVHYFNDEEGYVREAAYEALLQRYELLLNRDKVVVAGLKQIVATKDMTYLERTNLPYNYEIAEKLIKLITEIA